MTRRSRRVWLLAAAISGGLCGAIALTSAQRSTVRVDRGPVGERIVARAVVVPSAGVTHVYALAAGQVRKLSVREGDRVERGQALAELEDVAGHPESVNAPGPGVVLARHIEVGDYALAGPLAANAWLFELADVTHTELRVEVEEPDAASVSSGMHVALSTLRARSQRASGQVERVSARLERRTIGVDDARVRADGMVRVVTVGWRGEHPDWAIGSRAEAVIEVRRREAAARLPRAALTLREGRSLALRPTWFGTWLREVPVEVVSVDEAFAEIRGLAVGTQVVVPAEAGESPARDGDGVDVAEAVR